MAENLKWVLKDTDGRVSGPYTTQIIIHLINTGLIAGEEVVAIYPGGNWFPISQQPEFYDRLLDAISEHESPQNQDDDGDNDKTTDVLQFPTLSPTAKPEAQNPSEAVTAAHNADAAQGPSRSHSSGRSSASKKSSRRKKRRAASAADVVIELVNINKLV
jgi:hypothetical protein